MVEVSLRSNRNAFDVLLKIKKEMHLMSNYSTEAFNYNAWSMR